MLDLITILLHLHVLQHLVIPYHLAALTSVASYCTSLYCIMYHCCPLCHRCTMLQHCCPMWHAVAILLSHVLATSCLPLLSHVLAAPCLPYCPMCLLHHACHAIPLCLWHCACCCPIVALLCHAVVPMCLQHHVLATPSTNAAIMLPMHLATLSMYTSWVTLLSHLIMDCIGS